MELGVWRSFAFRGYYDTTLDVERDMSKLLIETENVSGEEADAADVPTLGNVELSELRPNVGR